MLFRLKLSGEKSALVPLKPTSMHEQGILEKTMEQWIADSPEAVLPEDERRVLVIWQETPFENVTDVIAIDARGDVVIIEIKRGQTPRDVIAQTLEYAADVAEWDYDTLNRRAKEYFDARSVKYASLLDAFRSTFAIADGAEPQFNQHQRIFIVAEQIEENIERTARWLLKRGVSITCVSYTLHASDERDHVLDFTEVVRPIEAQGEASLSRESAAPPTEQEWVERLPETLKRVYRELRANTANFGNGIQYATTRNGPRFRATQNFAEIQWRSREGCLIFYVRPEGFNLREGEESFFEGITIGRVPDTHRWALNHWFKISEGTDLAAAIKLLQRSYAAVA